METIWFCIVAVMLAAYVLLDGFDIGAGAIHLFAARGDAERRAVISSIGPVWDGNEVWLLAAGGVLYFAFPGLYAAGFSGFYLALMMVLWLLMLRGLSVELRSHFENPMWHSFWDAVFCGSSVLLAIFYGAALGNVVRGVPLNKDGYFFVPLWTNFQPGSNPGIIDWFTVLVGVTALLVLILHGSLWVMLKTEDQLAARVRSIASSVYWAVCVAVLGISWASFTLQPHLGESFEAHPLLWVFPLVGVAGLFGVRMCLSAHADLWAFLCSCVFIAGLLCSAAFGLYPNVLPSITDPSLSLTINNVAAPAYGLRIGFAWWIPAFLLASAYSFVVYRHFRGKVPTM
ncbi:MAG TPA: cytochrome d ubiquinol oxidase subunit II [Bryobacteraceae bacterium]|nr:cytochrome d ubiquinol oxidase subunit II [Bryobacteraceae bacterium]